MDHPRGTGGRLEIADSVIFEILDDEAVILEMNTGNYFKLNPTGTAIWKLIDEFGDIHQVQQAMLESYSVAPEDLKADVDSLVQRLESQGLLVVQPN